MVPPSNVAPDVPTDNNPKPPHDNPSRCASCGASESLQRCASCKQVMYCNASHQKAHWKAHKYFCVPAQQMGLHVHLHEGSEVYTPTFVPEVTSPSIEALDRSALSKILECGPQDLDVVEAPVCAVLPPSSPRIVLVFNGKHSTAYSTVEGSDVTLLALGPARAAFALRQGRALVFYLESKDFMVEPDYKAAVAAARAWVSVGLPTSGKDILIVQNLYKSVSTLEADDGDRAGQDSHPFQCLVFPALGEKPFISRIPLWLKSSDDPYEGSYHSFPNLNYLGDGTREMQYVSQRHEPHWMARQHDHIGIVMRDRFLVDGSLPNRSIHRTAGGRARHTWAGNLYAYGIRGNSELARDITVQDVDVVIEHFKKYLGLQG